MSSRAMGEPTLSVDVMVGEYSSVNGSTASMPLSQIDHHILNVGSFGDLTATCLTLGTVADLVFDGTKRKSIAVTGILLDGQQLTCFVDENHPLNGVFPLFQTPPSIRFVFDSNLIPFEFPRGSHAPRIVDVYLDFFCGSKNLGIMIQKEVKARSVSFKWPGKMKEKHDGKKVCDNGMESLTAGLGTENACVFIVRPVGDFKEDVYTFLDTNGLHTDHNVSVSPRNDEEMVATAPINTTKSALEEDLGCKLGILFREAKYLKKSLRGCIGGELCDDPTVYLLLFRDI